MSDRPRLVLFCEDRDHEQFVRALVRRLAHEVGMKPIVRAPSARGGHGRAVREFGVWQESFLSTGRQELPDVLVLAVDANCSPWNEVRGQLEEAIEEGSSLQRVVACPDPHVERWYIADPSAFRRVVGALPGRDPAKCERHLYKRFVQEAAAAAGTPLLTGTADLAGDIVECMDLYRAGKAQPSLGYFVRDLRAALRRLASLPDP